MTIPDEVDIIVCGGMHIFNNNLDQGIELILLQGARPGVSWQDDWQLWTGISPFS